MSLLPATSHANPTTPFWATAGSGDGLYNAGVGIEFVGNVINSLSTTHISVSANATQTVSNIDTALSIVWDTIESSYGGITWNPAIPNKIKITESGTYRFLFSAQIDASASNKQADIYLRRNGVVEPRTRSVGNVSNKEEIILTAEFILQVNVDDQFELMLLSPDDPGMSVINLPSGGSPPNDFPSSPACVLNIQRVL